MNYYNEFDPYAAEWLRNLIKAGHIPNGEVDVRSIVDVQPDDLRGFTQCHFFAGIAGWSHALRLAGWDDEREIWTGSCPCQPFSVAGKGAGTDDPRHLWPHFFRLISACRPQVVMGEQVAGAAGYGWLDGVRTDLEGEGYACEGIDIPACAVNAPHIRQRLYWVARALVDTKSIADNGAIQSRKRQDISGGNDGRRARQQLEDADACGDMADTDSQRLQGQRADGDKAGRRGSDVSASGLCGRAGDGDMADATGEQEHEEQQRPPADEGEWRPDGIGGCGMDYRQGRPWDDMADADSELHNGSGNIGAGWRTEYPNGCVSSFWDDAEWLTGADGKTRRVKPGVRLLAHGVPARVGRLRAYGNAIVPPLAAEVIKSFMETTNG